MNPMTAGSTDSEDALAPGGGRTAGLLDQHRHRVGLVHQAQLAALPAALLVHRVHEHAAAGQDAVHVGDHRGHPAHVVVLAERAFLALQHLVVVTLDRRLPVARVGRVDGELLGIGRDAHEGLGVDEAAHLAVEREGRGQR